MTIYLCCVVISNSLLGLLTLSGGKEGRLAPHSAGPGEWGPLSSAGSTGCLGISGGSELGI